MTTNVSPEKKDSILKTLAIAGFVGVLILVAWLAIQLVNVFPSAISSLASLAEGVNQSQETTLNSDRDVLPLTVNSNTSLANVGDDVTITWSEVNASGSFIFSYECIDGVALAQQTDSGVRAIDCDTNYNIGDVSNLTVAIESEKNRYADIAYDVSFLRTNDTTARAAGNGVFTVVNTDITNQFANAGDTTATLATESVTEDVDTTDSMTDADATEPVDDTTDTVDETPVVAPTTPIEAIPTFAVPVSDPNGNVDLRTTLLGLGDIVDGAFIAGPITNTGAFQFEVINIGTKTSDTWNYTMILPNGQTYISDPQAALLPNERVLLTVGLPSSDSDSHTFVVAAAEPADENVSNNSFSQRVTFAQ